MKAKTGWHREKLRHSQARRLGKAYSNQKIIVYAKLNKKLLSNSPKNIKYVPVREDKYSDGDLFIESQPKKDLKKMSESQRKKLLTGKEIKLKLPAKYFYTKKQYEKYKKSQYENKGRNVGTSTAVVMAGI